MYDKYFYTTFHLNGYAREECNSRSSDLFITIIYRISYLNSIFFNFFYLFLVFFARLKTIISMQTKVLEIAPACQSRICKKYLSFVPYRNNSLSEKNWQKLLDSQGKIKKEVKFKMVKEKPQVQPLSPKKQKRKAENPEATFTEPLKVSSAEAEIYWLKCH